MCFKLHSLVRRLSAWAWREEIESSKLSGGVRRWNTRHEWWHWYVVKVGPEGGHDVRGHAYPIVAAAWDAARECVPNRELDSK